MTDQQTFPWHSKQWALLESALEHDRFHHAVLIHGQRGIGKHAFAERLAGLLLCESTAAVSQRPCGECRGCRLVNAGSHPDRLMLTPEEGKAQISVEQVRALIRGQLLTSHYGGYRVVTLAPAHALSASAANALLKTLEEPPQKHVFILLSDRPTALPVTLRSRCLSLLMSSPDSEQAKAWLAQVSDLDEDWEFLLKWTGGAPLATLEAAKEAVPGAMEDRLKGIVDLVFGRTDPIAAAGLWQKTGLSENLNWQLRLLAQLMRQRAAGLSSPLFPSMRDIAGQLDFAALNRIYDELMELRDAHFRNLHPNDRLALEGLAVTWQLASGRKAAPH